MMHTPEISVRTLKMMGKAMADAFLVPFRDLPRVLFVRHVYLLATSLIFTLIYAARGHIICYYWWILALGFTQRSNISGCGRNGVSTLCQAHFRYIHASDCVLLRFLDLKCHKAFSIPYYSYSVRDIIYDNRRCSGGPKHW